MSIENMPVPIKLCVAVFLKKSLTVLILKNSQWAENLHKKVYISEESQKTSDILKYFKIPNC